VPAVIAGGALRDLAEGIDHKDIDIFIPAKSPSVYPLDLANRFKVDLEGALGPGRWVIAPNSFFAHYVADCSFALEIMSGDLQVQIIGLDVEPTADTATFAWHVLNRMDFGRCQIAWTGEDVLRTEAYSVDWLLNEFTLNPDLDWSREKMERSLKRFSRFQEKFPSANLGVPICLGPLAHQAEETIKNRLS